MATKCLKLPGMQSFTACAMLAMLAMLHILVQESSPWDRYDMSHCITVTAEIVWNLLCTLCHWYWQCAHLLDWLCPQCSALQPVWQRMTLKPGRTGWQMNSSLGSQASKQANTLSQGYKQTAWTGLQNLGNQVCNEGASREESMQWAYKPERQSGQATIVWKEAR